MKAGGAKRALVWAGILVLVGVLALIEVFVTLSPWVWVVLLVAAGAGALVVYLTDRTDWSLLVPAYVMFVVALLIVLTSLHALRDDATAVFVLVAIAIPFLVVFVRNRKQWWTLIPAYVLAAVALMVGLEGAGILREPLVAPYVLFAVAIPFFVVFARRPKRWWSIIPAVVLTIVGLSMLIAQDVGEYVGPLVLLAVGITIVVRLLARRGRAVSGP